MKTIHIKHGKMNRRGQVIIPKAIRSASLFMKSDPELAQSVARAYSNKEAENFATDEQIDDLLKDINILSEK
jgi:bifunctional DNA-binding transcriptional regulator/antitoxin component of YhaV-PrlF toxin-antitoxin module